MDSRTWAHREVTIDVLERVAWVPGILDPDHDGAWLDSVAAALTSRDRDRVAACIIGGGTLGDALETADALLAALRGEELR